MPPKRPAPVLLLLAVLLSSLTAPSCQRVKRATDTVVPLTAVERAPVKPSGPVSVGVLLPLSGPVGAYGRECLNGMELARADLARAGGSALEFRTADDAADPEEAKKQFTLLSKAGATAVLGPITSTNALVVAPLAEELHLPLLTPSATAFDVTIDRPYVSRVCFVDPMQGAAMALFATEDLEATRAMICAEEGNRYAAGLADAFAAAFERLDGTVVGRWSFPAGTTDFAALAGRIAALPADQRPEVVFFPDYFPEAARFCVAAKVAGVRAKILGGDGWDSDQFYPLAGDAAPGHYLCTHFSPEDTEPTVRDFVTRYEETYHARPGALAALGYDAVRLLGDALHRARSFSPEDLRDAIASTRGFSGVTGRITLDENRNPVKNVVLLETGEKGPKFVRRIEYEVGGR